MVWAIRPCHAVFSHCVDWDVGFGDAEGLQALCQPAPHSNRNEVDMSTKFFDTETLTVGQKVRMHSGCYGLSGTVTETGPWGAV